MSERAKTRDRLLNGCNYIPPIPIVVNTSIPPKNKLFDELIHQFYLIAIKNGFQGTEEDYISSIGTGTISNEKENQIIFSNYENFPQIGQQGKFYFDLTENILYYWQNEYLPVNAMLIENSIIEGGGA